MLRRLRLLTINRKLMLFPVLSVALLLVMEFATGRLNTRLNNEVINPAFRTEILQGNKTALQALVQTEAIALGERLKGIADKQQQVDLIIKETDPIRFFDDKSGYFFTYNTAGVRLNVTINKSLNGTPLIDSTDCKGFRFVEKFVEAGKAGGGFVEYFFEKPGKGAQPKLSYVASIPGTEYIIGTGVYIDNVEEIIATFDGKLAAANWTFRAYRLAIIGGAIVLLVFISWVIARGIIRPILATATMLKDIAQGEGNLTGRLDAERQDEIGEMARWFNLFVEKLQGMIQQIAANTQTLAGSSQALSTTATRLYQGAEGASHQTVQIASAAELMASNMHGMAQSTEEMSTNIRVVASAVEEMTASISEVARNAEQAASVASTAATLAATSNSQIGTLSDAAGQIGKVTEVIQDIAEQTNLLALNATIEAARAGDAGKGFAVVATEVKELAKQTTLATEDIRKRIEKIQGATNQAVQSVGEISSVIDHVNEISRTIATAVEEQSITTKEIATNVARSSQNAEGVAKGIADSASTSSEITRDIVAIDQAAHQSVQEASKNQEAGQEVIQVVDKIHTLLEQFRV
jgi:methyl-accepting chemotaxis protein